MRTSTPPTITPSGGRSITVQRSCERCGRDVGDATAAELEAAVDGRPLPPVAAECGCLAAAAAVTTLDQHTAADLEFVADVKIGVARYRCMCGHEFDTVPEVSAYAALSVHQVEVVRDAIREVLA